MNEGLSEFGSVGPLRSDWGGPEGVEGRHWGQKSDRPSACLSSLLNSYAAAVFKQHGWRGWETETSQKGSATGPEKGVWLPAPRFPAHFPGQWRKEVLFSPHTDTCWLLGEEGSWLRDESLGSSQVKAQLKHLCVTALDVVVFCVCLNQTANLDF